MELSIEAVERFNYLTLQYCGTSVVTLLARSLSDSNIQ